MPPDSDVFSTLTDLPGVEAAVERARAAVDDLRAHRVLRRRAEEVSAESALHGAWASAALEGLDLPLDDFRRGPEGGLALGALRAVAEVGPLVRTWGRAPLQALARLHTVAARDLADPDSLGRPTAAAAPRLSALAAAVTGGTAAPALVLSAVVHAEAALAFEVGGGIVGRAAGRLVLVERGLDPKALSVPEAGHRELGAEAYQAALAAYSAGSAEGLVSWLEHCAQAVVLGAREGLAISEALLRG